MISTHSHHPPSLPTTHHTRPNPHFTTLVRPLHPPDRTHPPHPADRPNAALFLIAKHVAPLLYVRGKMRHFWQPGPLASTRHVVWHGARARANGVLDLDNRETIFFYNAWRFDKGSTFRVRLTTPSVGMGSAFAMGGSQVIEMGGWARTDCHVSAQVSLSSCRCTTTN